MCGVYYSESRLQTLVGLARFNQMKHQLLFSRIVVSVCTGYFIGAIMWLWSAFPIVEDWYSRQYRAGFLLGVCFKFYSFDWCAGLMVILTAILVFRNVRLEQQGHLKQSFALCVGALATGTIFALSGLLLRNFLSVPALDWDPNHPNWITYALNFVLLVSGAVLAFVKKP